MTAKVNGDAGSSRVISLARFIMGTYYYLPLVVPQDV